MYSCMYDVLLLKVNLRNVLISLSSVAQFFSLFFPGALKLLHLVILGHGYTTQNRDWKRDHVMRV